MRDRTEYVSISDYNASNLRNDYHFLEDALQTKLRAKSLFNISKSKIRKIRNNCKTDGYCPSSFTEHQKLFSLGCTPAAKKLLKACVERKVKLVLLSNGMTKRKLNSTYFQVKTNLIFWRVHIVFILSSTFDIPSLFKIDSLEDRSDHFTKKDNLVEVCIPTVCENIILTNLIQGILNPSLVNLFSSY
jgi:hypothetical protein